MQRIFYANDTFLTGSEIAQSMLAYADELAKRESSATIEIPIRRDDGYEGRATLLIGPASQLIAETVPDDGRDELVEPASVERIRLETARLAIPIAEPLAAEDAPSLDDGMDGPGLR